MFSRRGQALEVGFFGVSRLSKLPGACEGGVARPDPLSEAEKQPLLKDMTPKFDPIRRSNKLN